MLCLYIEAPFAACRTFTAGWYRPAATFLTPSAAYGLLLNVAGIESRSTKHDEGHDGRTPASLMRPPGLPQVRLALGVPSREGGEAAFPEVQTVYQQLHNYPVGKEAGIAVKLSKGNKNNITPVRRELLSRVQAIVCLDGNANLEDRVRVGLRGDLNEGRYGLPFLGDNQFLLDRLEEPRNPPAARWYERVRTKPRDRAAASYDPTYNLDRPRMTCRGHDLGFTPSNESSTEPPPGAWTEIAPPAPVTIERPTLGRGRN